MFGGGGLDLGHSGLSLVGVYQSAMHRLAAVAPQVALNDCFLIWRSEQPNFCRLKASDEVS